MKQRVPCAELEGRTPESGGSDRDALYGLSFSARNQQMEKTLHRLFSFTSMNWRWQPLVSHEVILKRIARPQSKLGLTAKAEFDSDVYPKGINLSEEDMAALQLG